MKTTISISRCIFLFTAVFFLQNLFAFKYNGKTIAENDDFERQQAGTTPSALKEISGMACSRTTEGYFWVHVDEGNSEIYALNQDGSIKQTVKLGGISKNDDWEDICMATVDGINYVLVGCIGDNKVRDGDSKGKQKYYVYRFREPAITSGTLTIPSGEIETITFTYDGQHNQADCKDKVSHNAETLMFDPLKKKIYIATKHKTEINALYETSWKSGSYTTVMNWVCDLGQTADKFLYLTAGDISADGTKIVIKNGSDVLLWQRQSDEDLSATLKRQPEHIKAYKEESQGEAIAWNNESYDFYTTSEGKNVPIYFYRNRNNNPTAINRPDSPIIVRISGNFLFMENCNEKNISLFDMQGREIVSRSNIPIDISNLRGIYILRSGKYLQKITIF